MKTNNKKIQELAEVIRGKVAERLPEMELTVKNSTRATANGLEECGLAGRIDDGVGFFFRLNDYLGADEEVVADMIVRSIRKMLLTTIQVNNLKDEVLNRDFVLEHISQIIAPASGDHRGKAVRTFVHPDFVRVLYVRCCTDDGMQGFAVPKLLLEIAGVTEDEAFAAAEVNDRREPYGDHVDARPVFIDMEKFAPILIARMMGMEAEIGDDLYVTDPPKSSMLMATNRSQFYGAICGFDAEMLRKAEGVLGERFVILPSSVHEILYAQYPDDGNLGFFGQMVEEVNLQTVAPGEVLMDTAYLYDHGSISRMDGGEGAVKVNIA